jgi:hypothetical protein
MCKYAIKDGAGFYCKLKSMKHDKNYPHDYWRTECFGNRESIGCILLKKQKRRTI